MKSTRLIGSGSDESFTCVPVHKTFAALMFISTTAAAEPGKFLCIGSAHARAVSNFVTLGNLKNAN